MRNHGRFGFMLAALAGVSLASTQAHADDANSSTGAASLKFDQTTGLGTGITTGPIAAGDIASIEVQVSLDPVANGGPLYSVSMPKGALIQASWAKDKKIVFKAQQGSSSDGLVTVRHTLAPTIDLQIKKFFPVKVHYDATQLLNVIPGAKFDFDSKAQQAFAPWGFTGVDTKLTRPSLETTTLFAIPFSILPNPIKDNVFGKLGVSATTTPTFTYKTTKIFLAGANGELNDATDELSLPATDGDYIEINAAVEGEMQAKGAISILPYLKIDKIQDNNIGVEFALPRIDKDYVSAVQKVPFQTVAVHIPMPNVHTPSNGVNLGDVKVGGSGNKKVTIENSGEKEAVLRFDSTDSAFEVPGNTVTVPPKSTYDLQVKFSPVNANPASATITVNSNDADSPEQTFKIGANGADVGDDGQSTSNADDGGCGCRAAGSASPVNGWAGAGLAGLAMVLGLRRRSKRHSA